MRAARSMVLIPLFAILVSLHAQSPAPAPSAQPVDARFERVAALVAQKMKELDIPGAALGVLVDGEVRTRGFGVTNVDHPQPVTAETLFQIGSISKTFTGTAIMRLVEQGKLRLDDPVRQFLPQFAVRDSEASRMVTVRDTLTHMSGWEGDFFDDPSSGDDALERIVSKMSTLEQTARVGEMWGYNNSGFYVAGRIVEVVTGKPFERALRELVLDPLGLEQAYYFPAEVMTHRFVVGHESAKGRTSVMTPWPVPRAANAAGGITTNVGSMLRYAAFHMGDGTVPGGARVLSSDSLRYMRSPIVPKAGSDQQMGLTWHLSQAGSFTVADHGGGTIGQISVLRLVPERRFAIAVVTNSGRGGTLNTQVARAAFDAYLGVAPPTVTRMTLDANALQEYAGMYRRQFADVTVAVDGDAVTLQVTPKLPGLDGTVQPAAPARRYGFWARDRLLQIDGPNAGEPAGEFIRGADGRVRWLRTSRIHRRVQAPTSTQ
jgi:CubicO group peptidase (beta-lactamase class C family)